MHIEATSILSFTSQIKTPKNTTRTQYKMKTPVEYVLQKYVLITIAAIAISSCAKTQHAQHNQYVFVSSFLQGAHNSNTAFRRHYYNHRRGQTQEQQQPCFLTSSCATGMHSLHQGSHPKKNKTQLFGLLDRFNFYNNEDENEDENMNENENGNSQDDGDDDVDEAAAEGKEEIVSINDSSKQYEEEEEDGNDDDDDDDDNMMDHAKIEYSSVLIESARQSFENMFSMPNDNQQRMKNNSKKKKTTTTKETPETTTTTTTASSSSFGPVDDPESDSFLNKSNSNNRHHEQDDKITTTKTSDITSIANTIPQPPLTAIARERRLKEISLLSSLKDSDEPVNELWALWIAERGPTAAALLLRAEHLMSVESYQEAESILWNLIQEHGIHWAEPLNRLATLKYMQGQLEESKKLCEMVLEVKPWHFGALSGIVLVCTTMNDATGARMWAERRLPPFVPNHTTGSRRMTWVSRAADDAIEQLHGASKVGRSANIGQEEMEFRSFRAQMQHLNMEREDEDASSSLSLEEGDLDAWQ